MPFNLPRATKGLLIANIAVFLLQWMLGGQRMAIFELWPWGASQVPGAQEFMPWQLLTSGFMHADFGHLFFNMLALVMFGSPVEYVWGERRFLTYYLVCVVGSGVCQLAFAIWSLHAQATIVSTVGASGGVYGLILAYGMLFPRQKVAIFPLPMLMTARTVAILYGLFALGYGVFGSRDGVAHFAHLGGMLCGWLLILYWRRPASSGKPPRPRPPLRIVR